MSDSEVNLSRIGHMAGVGRVAVAGWRRRSDDFPEPVGGTATSPTFRLAGAERWLRGHSKIPEPRPARGAATVSFTGGPTVTLLSSDLTTDPMGSNGFGQLGGFIPVDAAMSWPAAGIERADVRGFAPFAVQRADIDISYAASARLHYLKLTWPAGERQALATPRDTGHDHPDLGDGPMTPTGTGVAAKTGDDRAK